jgi:phosphohistidine phosphatase SixA
MLLILVRHGHAGPEAGQATVLTSHGVKEVLRTAAFLKRQGVAPSGIRHSPRKRARETAEHLADALGSPRTLLDGCEDLGPDAGAADSLAEVEDGPEGTWLWVSHLPTLQSAARALVGEASESLHFPPACAVALQREGPGPWRVLWAHPGS